MSRGKPHPYLEKEFKYMRMANVAYFSDEKIKYWIYTKLSKYYERKYEKIVLSRQLNRIEQRPSKASVRGSIPWRDAICEGGSKMNVNTLKTTPTVRLIDIITKAEQDGDQDLVNIIA